jgi:hypothetical protein
MKMSRVWASANGDTFQCRPIGEFVQRYLVQPSIDPFARNCAWATYTNDLNPDTIAQYHVDVLEFLELMLAQGVQAKTIIFDPPYSPRQIKETYNGIGREMTQEDGWRTAAWTKEKYLCDRLLKKDGVFLHFGWNSMGIARDGYDLEEILLVCHGAAHSDTICMAQRKHIHQLSMF